MAAGYDPFQQNFQMGGALGDIGGNVLKVLMLLGGMGKGPFKGLEGLFGFGGKEEEGATPQVATTGGQQQAQIQQPPLLAPQGGPPPGGPPGGMPPSGPPPMGGQMGGQLPPEMMQRIMEMLRMFGGQGGQGPMGGMGGGLGR